MKVGSYVPVNSKIESVKHFRPCQHLLFNVRFGENLTSYSYVNFRGRLNLSLQNSNSGTLSTIVPSLPLNVLGDISTYNEGVVLIKNQSILFPVLLNPTANVSLSNDKYLDISLTELQGVVGVDIYAFELGVNSDFLTSYSKMNCPAGNARSKFSVGENDFLSIPTTGFDELQITYKNGFVSTLTHFDLEYHMAQNNDMTAYRQAKDLFGNPVLGISAKGLVSFNEHLSDLSGVVGFLNGGTSTVDVVVDAIMSCANNYVMVLDEVSTIEIIRDTDSSKVFEFVLADFINAQKR